MAVETGAIFNSITFGGVNSADYGIYVTGDAVYDAPKRATKLVSVPGRNGAVAIDQGYWENITLTYPAGVFGDDQQDFAEAIRAYRNALASKIGYQRLTDTYHPDEYRMAMFVDGVEVDPKSYGRAGQFSLKFECKPQRWLTSGETTVTVASGDVLTNPTLYGASPLLRFSGYGKIVLESPGYFRTIDVQRVYPGTTAVNNGGTYSGRGISGDPYAFDVALDTSNLNSGDKITIGAVQSELTNFEDQPNSTLTLVSEALNGASWSYRHAPDSLIVTLGVPAGKDTFTFGISETRTHSAVLRWDAPGQVGFDKEFILTLEYDGASTITVSSNGFAGPDVTVKLDEITAYSTKVNETGIVVDLEIGEAWFNDGADANYSVSLGSNLPVLIPGNTRLYFYGGISNLRIQPRWWQL